MTEEIERTLAELLASGPLTYERFLDYASQIAHQLEAMHGAGHGHGSISALAVRISPENRVTLDATSPALEATPEVVRNELYQVGILFTQMLVATKGDSKENQIHPILSDIASLGGATRLIPVEARLLLEELLAEDPRQRISSAHELASTVTELRELHRLPVEPSVPPAKDRSRLYFLIAMLVLMAAICWMTIGILNRP